MLKQQKKGLELYHALFWWSCNYD